MPNPLTQIKDYFFPPKVTKAGTASSPLQSRIETTSPNNPNRHIAKVQLQRLRHDIQMWFEAVVEAENPWYPHRVRQQRMFMNTVLNEHVFSCMDRRRNLTLLRDFKICDAEGNEDENAKKIFRDSETGKNTAWFDNYLTYVLDAQFYGYSLIYLGDVTNDSFPELTIIRRHNISPDRLNVAALVYSLSGQPFTEDPLKDWNIWVPTPTELGVSNCGYGLLYKIAKTEIYLRNNTAYNADYVELYGQPIRVGKTNKTGEEYDAFEGGLRDLGQNAYMLMDNQGDEVELLEHNAAGRGFMTYEDFEKRLEAKISKVLLGHAAALDSTPGKLGSDQGEKSPTAKALEDIQTKDGIFAQGITNSELIPRMIKIGFNIPVGYHFEFLNSGEEEEFRQREDDSNKKTADIMKIIKEAGGEPDWAYFSERTGINVVKAEIPKPVITPLTDPNLPTPGKNGNGKPKKDEVIIE